MKFMFSSVLTTLVFISMAFATEHSQSNYEAIFEDACIKTNIHFGLIEAYAAQHQMERVPESLRRNYFAGIRPKDRAIFTSNDNDYSIGIGYGGEITVEARRMHKAGLLAESIKIDAGSTLPDPLGMLPDDVIGRSKCKIVMMHATPSQIVDEFKAVEFRGSPIGEPHKTFTKPPRIRPRIGAMQGYHWKLGSRWNLNIAVSYEPVSGDDYYIETTLSGLVYRGDESESYTIN